MTTQVRPLDQHSGSRRTGTVTLVLGILFTAAVAFSYPLSLSQSFDPPDWARLLGLAWLPVGLAGVPIGYALAAPGPGRARARLGAVVALAGLVAFAVLVTAVG